MSNHTDLTTQARDALALAMELEAEIDRLTQLREQALTLVKEEVDAFDAADIDGKTVLHYATVTSKVIDTKKLKDLRPDLAAMFTVERVSRPFRIDRKVAAHLLGGRDG